MTHHIDIGGHQGRDCGADEAEEHEPMTDYEAMCAVALGFIGAAWVALLGFGAGWLLDLLLQAPQ